MHAFLQIASSCGIRLVTDGEINSAQCHFLNADYFTGQQAYVGETVTALAFAALEFGRLGGVAVFALLCVSPYAHRDTQPLSGGLSPSSRGIYVDLVSTKRSGRAPSTYHQGWTIRRHVAPGLVLAAMERPGVACVATGAPTITSLPLHIPTTRTCSEECACRELGMLSSGLVPYCVRQSGASVDRRWYPRSSLEVCKSSRRASLKSVVRYENGA